MILTLLFFCFVKFLFVNRRLLFGIYRQTMERREERLRVKGCSNNSKLFSVYSTRKSLKLNKNEIRVEILHASK